MSDDGMPTILPDEIGGRDARGRRRRGKDTWFRRRTRRIRHFVSRHKALAVIIGVILLLLTILLIWLLWIWLHLKTVPRFDLDLHDRPEKVGGINILLVGLDCDEQAKIDDALRHCSDGEAVDLHDLDEAAATGNRSDVLMVLHISEDGEQAQVISIPRDSYVPVEGHGSTKINAAFSYGGPSLLVQTVEQYTGLYIDHVAVVDFQGFRGITEAIGGVMVYVPEAIADPRTGQVVWPKGWQRLEGESALAYVRTRYGLPRGDFDRVQRHQNFLRAVMARSQEMSVLANPVSLTRLIDEVSSNLAVDSDFSTTTMFDLATQALQWRMSDVQYATVPLAGQGTAMIDGASVVTLDRKLTRQLFAAIARDEFDEFLAAHTIETLPSEERVK